MTSCAAEVDILTADIATTCGPAEASGTDVPGSTELPARPAASIGSGGTWSRIWNRAHSQAFRALGGIADWFGIPFLETYDIIIGDSAAWFGIS